MCVCVCLCVTRVTLHLNHVSASLLTVSQSQCGMAVQHCCKGDTGSLWETAILGWQNFATAEPID